MGGSSIKTFNIMLEGCVIYTSPSLHSISLHIPLSSPPCLIFIFLPTEGEKKKKVDDFIDNNGGCAEMSLQAVMLMSQAQEMNIYNIIVKCPP